MTIDEAIGIITAKGNYSYTVIENEAKDVLVDTARKYQMVRVDYEHRLKADKVAMLEDLKQDFIAEAFGIEMDCTDYVVNVADIDKVIRQKINELKAESEG